MAPRTRAARPHGAAGSSPRLRWRRPSCDRSGDGLQRIWLPAVSFPGAIGLFVEYGNLDLGKGLRIRQPRTRFTAAVGNHCRTRRGLRFTNRNHARRVEAIPRPCRHRHRGGLFRVGHRLATTCSVPDANIARLPADDHRRRRGSNGKRTVHTARGHHFSDLTANGSRVRKGDPIDGMAGSVTSIALPLRDDNGDALSPAESDSRVMDAVRKAIAGGSKVLLQIMDSSKLGRRVPSERCLRHIRDGWPDAVQVVVDACQMRLGRRRIRAYLASGYMVLITGSKFFTGPPFSGALLVPADLSNAVGRTDRMAWGLLDYSARSDWPRRWDLLRRSFPLRANFGTMAALGSRSGGNSGLTMACPRPSAARSSSNSEAALRRLSALHDRFGCCPGSRIRGPTPPSRMKSRN